LEKYVYNRDSLLKEKALKDVTNTSVSKERLLIVLETNKNQAETLGVFSLQLYNEIKQIRDFLYKHLYVKRSEIYKYCQNNKDFNKKSLESKKIYVQSIYLQSVETDYVYALILFLFSTVKNQVNIEKKIEEENPINYDAHFLKNRFIDYFYTCQSIKGLNLNKTEIMQEIDYQISCVPLFDGLFVSSENPFIQLDLGKIVSFYSINI
jgi:hypothetical protein